MMRSFKEWDFFRKLPPEHRENGSPASGASLVFRSLSCLLIGVLVFTEVRSFASPAARQRFDLDIHSSVNADSPRKIRVLLNITVLDFPCIDLSLDYQDVMGTRAVDVRTTLFKERLHKNGSVVDSPLMKNDPKATDAGTGGAGPSQFANHTGNKTCLTCYGALPDGQCCNTCADVLYAYRLKRWALPRIESIEQCKHDGTARSAYQPPQIIRLNDYSSDDYLPKFSRLGNLSGSGSEARISTPFRWNLTLEPLRPLASAYGGRALQPLSLNFSSGFKHLFEDDDDLYGGDDDDADDEILDADGANASGSDAKKKKKLKPWPACVLHNVIVHGYDLGEALMIDLSKHGAKSGCWNDDCTSTDKFESSSMDRCAEVCKDVEACKWWTHGLEDGVGKCWIRTGRHDRQRRYGFSSGSHGCAPNGTSAAASAPTPEPAVEASPPTPEPPTPVPPPAVEGAARRLTSFEDEDDSKPYGFNFGRSFHMPMFGMDTAESRMRKEQKGESCRLHGYFDTNKVPGNFHIGTHGANTPSYLSYWDDPAPPTQNMQHTINSLAFVEVDHTELLNVTQPLDGFESPKAFTFQYYLTITPATIPSSPGGVGGEKHGYQFRAGSFVTNELIGPAVFFRMDIDPIRVTYYTEDVRWSSFLINICAVVGGIVAITSTLGQLAESAAECVTHKD
mmetsp:Transcript_44987/g.144151  ORF Transcript_44987/g.144151 Transcript_44987/m.144151 type:complete len:678 (+) Transcript_44987:133-2166(+)